MTAGPGRDAALLLDEAPLRAIVRLATPTTLVMLVAATSNVAATWYVSRLGPGAIAAIALVFPVALLATTAMIGGLGAGTSSAVARALGTGRPDDAARLAEHAVALSAGLGIAFAFAVGVAAPAIFRTMGGRGEVLDAAVLYARILFSGAAITFLGSMLDGVMRGAGNVRVPAICSAVSLGLQLAVTPLCMFGAGLGLAGAPIAILACQLVATVARARYVYLRSPVVRPRLWPRRFRRAAFGEILRVGVPSSLSATVSYLGVIVLTGVVARLGTAHLAAFGLGMRMDIVVLTVVFGVGTAVLTLVGMATGAGRADRVCAYVWHATAIVVGILLVPTVVLWWRPALWIGLFTDDAAVLAVGERYFRIVGPSYPFLGAAMVASFAFQGLGRTTLPLAWVVARVTTVLVASVLCTGWLGLAERAVFAVMALGNGCSWFVMASLFRWTLGVEPWSVPRALPSAGGNFGLEVAQAPSEGGLKALKQMSRDKVAGKQLKTATQRSSHGSTRT